MSDPKNQHEGFNYKELATLLSERHHKAVLEENKAYGQMVVLASAFAAFVANSLKDPMQSGLPKLILGLCR